MKTIIQKGKVWLVGAGPSDIALLTLKGKEVLQNADVVVYDRLVGQAILGLIPETAEKIDVGKQARNHPVPQEEINRILLRLALEGKKVVRLKGGDPFVFGRGGEELELLEQHQVEFEVVPGVTSAIAAAAYAGIPVTHRDYASSLHIITAHPKRGKQSEIAYSELVKLDGTLIFLMGVGALKEICEKLLAAGMVSDMPAAMIENGTASTQRVFCGTVSNLPKLAEQHKIKAPAVIVVGRVCSLAKKLQWAEKRPLYHRRVFVMRPQKRASEFSVRLRQLGAEVIECPAIRTETLERNTRLGQAFSEIETYHWAAFTSVAGVDAFFQKLKERRIDVRRLCGLKFAAIGSATRDAIESRGILVEYMPLIYDTEHLARGLAKRVHPKEKVLIPRALRGSKELTKILSECGIAYDDIPVYQTWFCQGEPLELCSDDIAAFTSASTVHGFVQRMGSEFDYSLVNALCIGEQTAAAAKEYRMKVLVAEEASIDSMIASLLQKDTELHFI